MDPALATCARETVKKYSLPSEEYSINGAGVAGEKSAAESVEAAASIVATPVIRVGKPSADEIVLTREITKDIFFRMWGGDLRDFHVFNFDLVDQHGQYMPVPPGMHIYLVDSGPPDRDLEVFPIEKSYQPANNQTNVEELDPDWETFIVGEGTRLRFRSPDGEDCYLNIPFWRPKDGIVVEIPERW
ncbi:hypothetical protein BD779DRAFT_1678228 [Infundibulicybe gibba]|nr:hypothetical protein BD779DRAFT_1678228 [Infundibulicybe gibba]